MRIYYLDGRQDSFVPSTLDTVTTLSLALALFQGAKCSNTPSLNGVKFHQLQKDCCLIVFHIFEDASLRFFRYCSSVDTAPSTASSRLQINPLLEYETMASVLTDYKRILRFACSIFNIC